MKRLMVLLLVSAMIVAFVAVGFADGTQYTYDDLNISQINSFLHDVGYSISWHQRIANDGTPYWVITDIQTGTKLVLIVYDLDTNNADEFESLQIDASFDLSSGISYDAINRWNRTRRYGKAYRDDEYDPVIEFNIDLRGGVTKQTVVNWIDLAIKDTRDFVDMIGY